MDNIELEYKRLAIAKVILQNKKCVGIKHTEECPFYKKGHCRLNLQCRDSYYNIESEPNNLVELLTYIYIQEDKLKNSSIKDSLIAIQDSYDDINIDQLKVLLQRAITDYKNIKSEEL